MAKKAKKPVRRPNISPLSLLRPRLDALFTQPAGAEHEASAIEADLTTVIAGINPDQYLPILVKAVSSAAAPVQRKLDEVLPAWLQKNDLIESLRLLVQRDQVESQDHEVAIAWLTAVGIAPTALQVERDPAFYRAYYGEDDLGSQGFLMLFWYTNRQRGRVRGINILVDFNPPWDGAAKDIVILPQRTPQDMMREFVDIWENQVGGVAIEELDAVAAKQQCFEIFVQNRTNEIRLHKDFIVARELLVKYLFALPDGPNTPVLTIEEFDELCQSGQATEMIQGFEKNVGRWVRNPDGTKMLVGAEMFLDEDDFD